MTRLYGLQYLRGLAACAVVAYHAADRAQRPFTVGEAGVDLFFVLSGFLMWAITDADSRPGRFLADRAKRIVPIYWIVTSVMLAGALAGLFPAVRLSVAHVVTSYAFLPSVSPSNGQIWPLLVPGWTLNYEVGFYLLFGAALCLPRAVQLGMLTAVLIALAAIHPLVGRDQAALYFYSDPHILEFLGGLWLAQLWRSPAFGHAATRGVLIATTVALCGLALALPAEWPKALRYGLPALSAVATILAFERRPGGIAELPALRLLGDASYSIYLWHTLALAVTAKVATTLHIADAVAIPLHMVAGIGIGLIGYAGLEKPVMRYFHRRKRLAAAALDVHATA